MTLETLKKSCVVKCPPSAAYQVFTAGIGAWWPLGAQSVFDGEAVTCVFEAQAGGHVYERSRDGGEALWGTVLIAEPGRRLAFTWHPGRAPHTAQEVTMRFLASEGGTRIELEHAGWEALGPRADETRKTYDTGWDDVLGVKFCQCANRHHAPERVT